MDAETPRADAAKIRAKEEAEFREREARRKKEEDDLRERREAEARAEEKRLKEEKQRRLEDERRRKKQEDEWKKMGSDKIMPLPPVPASCVDDGDPSALHAWHLDDETSKPSYRRVSLKPGKKLDAPSVTLSSLRELGIVYFRISLSDFSIVNQIVKERCYKHTDEIHLSQTCKDEQFLEKWFMEHYMEDEEIRLITDGSCYYDVRAKQDTWIRLECSAGDIVVLPPGMYHRGTLDESDYCSVMRLFRDAHRWNPVYRTEKKAEGTPARAQYLRALKRGNVAVDMGFK